MFFVECFIFWFLLRWWITSERERINAKFDRQKKIETFADCLIGSIFFWLNFGQEFDSESARGQEISQRKKKTKFSNMRPSSTQWKVAAALAALFLITVVNGQLFSGKTTHAVSIFGFWIDTAAQFVWKISVDLDFPGFWSFYDQIGRIRVKFGRWFSDISVILSSQKEFQESFQHPPADWQIKFPIFFCLTRVKCVEISLEFSTN